MTSDPERDPHQDRREEEEWVPEDDSVIGIAFRWSLLVIAVIVAGVLIAVYAFRDRSEPESIRTDIQPEVPQTAESLAILPTVTFSDVTQEAGINFVHNSGAVGEKLLPETMGSGAAFFDYDNDHDPDLLLVNAQDWPHSARERESTMALYQNDGSGRFRDVTLEAGLARVFYGVGVAVGDYDNDGWLDVFLTALGENHLFRNRQGRFQEVTAQARVGGQKDDWSSSAGFFDADRDGRSRSIRLQLCPLVARSRFWR